MNARDPRWVFPSSTGEGVIFWIAATEDGRVGYRQRDDKSLLLVIDRSANPGNGFSENWTFMILGIAGLSYLPGGTPEEIDSLSLRAAFFRLGIGRQATALGRYPGPEGKALLHEFVRYYGKSGLSMAEVFLARIIGKSTKVDIEDWLTKQIAVAANNAIENCDEDPGAGA
jgi:hypothetical protein